MTVRFELYPAIDILGGSCVRLHQGDYAEKTEYSKDPRQIAARWLSQGARWLHVVDLDAAKSGTMVNAQVISDIVQMAAEVGAKVQVGGGIRTHQALSNWLHQGVTRCVVGTAALDTVWMKEAVSQFGSESLIVGLDGREGKLAVKGWIEQTEILLNDIAMQLAEVGVKYALVTDVSRDGTLAGANLALASSIQNESGLAVLASGGIRHLDDVLAAQTAGLAGAIIGQSLYTGSLDLGAAVRAVYSVVSPENETKAVE